MARASEGRITDMTVGIPTCDDDPRTLARLLEAILAEPLDERPIVVDMSRGGDVAAVVAGRAEIHYDRYAGSLGISDSRNRIVDLSPTRYLLMIDADAVPERGWASAMRAAFDEAERAAVVGARCLPAWPHRPPPLFDTAPALDWLGMFDLGRDPLDVPRIMGTSYALDLDRVPRNPTFPLDVGRTPRSFLAGEEVVLCEAVSRAGWGIRYQPRAVVRHHLRPERLSWRWMVRRAFVAGRESRRTAYRLRPLPRRLGRRDQAFLAAVAPAYFAGRARG